jgi:hypothetical protein
VRDEPEEFALWRLLVRCYALAAGSRESRAFAPRSTGFAILTNPLASPGAQEWCEAQQAFSRFALVPVVGRWLLVAFVHPVVLHLLPRLEASE